MNNNELLLNEMGQKLNIKWGVSEKKELWRQRIIYSAIGMMALASLWDMEDEEPISITHFKHRIERQIYAYRELYPVIMQRFMISAEELSQEMYDIYSSTGFIYHTPNRISAAKETEAKVGTIVCVRGANLKRNLFMSGLGTYFKTTDVSGLGTLNEMFRLPEQTLEEEYKSLSVEKNWSIIDTKNQVEYLRLQPPFSRGYWKETPDTDGSFSLLRFGMPGEKIYYLYKYEEGQCFGKALPSWKVNENQYRRLANVLLFHKGTLPPIIFSESGDIVTVHLKYLLPPSELWLLKTYSWPANFLKLPSDFNRVINKEVFEAFKETLEKLGYQFTKE